MIVTGLRRAAADLGITRQKLARFIAEGLPITRKSERVLIDLEEARAWIALNEGFGEETPKLAAVLNPDDPRHRERTAAANISVVEFGIERGELLRRDDVRRVTEDMMATMRNAVQYLHRYLGAEVGTANGGEVAAALKEALADIARPFRPDAPFPWPQPSPTPPTAPDFSEFDGEREMLPKLVSGDPRFDVAMITRQRREAEFAKLKTACVPWDLVRKTFSQCHAIVFKHLNQIPAKAAKKIGPKPVSRDTINDVVDTIGHDALWAMHTDLERLHA